MHFVEVATTSARVASTSSRSTKRDEIAALLSRLDQDEVACAVAFLVGEPRQGRIGVGWRTLASASASGGGASLAASTPSLTIGEVDRTFDELAALTGAGSGQRRQDLLVTLMARATTAEWSFLERLLGGDLRQGASEGVMVEAVAMAAGVPSATVRRALMLGGRLEEVASLGLVGGRAALEAVSLRLGRPVQPMLASTATSVAGAVDAIGEASVEWKLDGIRIQVHRVGDEVRIWTRNLNEITERLPGVVDVTLGLPATSLVLDGEAIGLHPDGRPRLFQDTVTVHEGDLRPYFFDLVHQDGRDLVDEELRERRARLHDLAGRWVVPSQLTDDPGVGERVLADALDAGHEGVVVKAAASRYEAGRRGKSWRKVKPVHTVDLVVLSVEWGHGRREGWLSNLHLGARSGEDFVMVGKTFKGLSDDLLRWQTERFCQLAGLPLPVPGVTPAGTVAVPPVQVVEVALDGVQRSTRYPGGVALRFARVVRYREDKDPSGADTLGTLRAMLAG